MNKTKKWFFEKINKIHIPLASLTKRKKEWSQINKIINKRGDITIDTNRNTKDHKRLPLIMICQQSGQLKVNG